MLSIAVRCGKKLKCWNTIPMSRRCLAASRGDISRSLSWRFAVADQIAVDVEPPGGDRLEMVDTPQEGRLARTRRPDEYQHLAAVDRQGHALQDLQRPEVLAHALGAHHGFVVRRDRLRDVCALASASSCFEVNRREIPREKYFSR